jgi:hypothetical protein
MPLVTLAYKPDRVLEQMANRLMHALPEIVAQALHVPSNEDAHLTEDEVEVRPIELRKSLNAMDIGIIIHANDYPERRQNLDERRNVVVEAVRRFLADYDRNLSVSVWVQLLVSSYGEI